MSQTLDPDTAISRLAAICCEQPGLHSGSSSVLAVAAPVPRGAREESARAPLPRQASGSSQLPCHPSLSCQHLLSPGCRGFLVLGPKTLPTPALECCCFTTLSWVVLACLPLQLLNAIQLFGANLDDYLHLLLPPIVKLFDAPDVPIPPRK